MKIKFKGTQEVFISDDKTRLIDKDDHTVASYCYGDNKKAIANTLLASKAKQMLDILKKLMAHMPKNNIDDASLYYEALELIKEATTINNN